MRELKLVLCGISEEYQLDEIMEYLVVFVNIWFDWSKYQREDYVDKFNVMFVDFYKEKKLEWYRIKKEI